MAPSPPRSFQGRLSDQIRHRGGSDQGSPSETGLCALLCGTAHYYAWDVVAYNPIKRSLGLLDELVALFEARTPAPEGDYAAAMFERRFPEEFLTGARLETWLAADRISAIRAALASPGTVHDGIRIEYRSTLDGLEGRHGRTSC
jgi:hypothetical protein